MSKYETLVLGKKANTFTFRKKNHKPVIGEVYRTRFEREETPIPNPLDEHSVHCLLCNAYLGHIKLGYNDLFCNNCITKK